MKIAIVGTGISGLGAAYLLAPNHDITLYEKNVYIGGHSRTIDVPGSGQNKVIPVDTGFIVFNDWNYPNLMGLFQELDVPFEKSDMSFGVSIDHGWLEYSSNHMFAQKKNLLRPVYWGMIADILRFNRQAMRYLEERPDITLGECLNELKMGDWFRKYYLLAMGAAIWSCPVETIMQFPAQTFLRFFKNHGLLSVNKRPQWYTVSGGSREYIKRLTAPLQDRIKLNCGVLKVMKDEERLHVLDNTGQTQIYDHVIFASHADQTIDMIDSTIREDFMPLESFGYQANKIIVHHDESFMPKNRDCWASWVYLSEGREDQKDVVALSYWMNNLQNLKSDRPIIITLNPDRRPQENLIIDEHEFSHPVFDLNAIQAQSQIDSIQGLHNLWFCGAYQRYGFHEDGLMSAVNVAKKLGAKIPWE